MYKSSPISEFCPARLLTFQVTWYWIPLFFCSQLLYPSSFFRRPSNRQRHIFQVTYPTNMHQHRIFAQILLILSVLNSVLAAPIVRVREMPKARGAVAVRVAREGVAAVLEKRPFEPDWETPAPPSTSGHPKIQPDTPAGSSTEHTGPQWDSSAPASPEHQIQPYTSPPTSPQHGEIQLYTPPPMSPQHGEIQPYTSPPMSPQHGEIQPYTPPPASPAHPQIEPYTSPPASPAHSGPQSTTIPPQPANKAPSKAVWREKIMTPEKIKATKYIAGAALFTAAYLSLLLPNVFNDGSNSKDSQS